VAIDRTSFWTRAAQYSFVVGVVTRALDSPVGAQARVSDQPDPQVDRVYQRNLNALKVLTRSLGATAIFVPQVMNDTNYSQKGVSRSWTPYIEDAAVPGLMRRFNGIMAGVCAREEDQCQYAGEILNAPWDGNDFIDEGHLSRRGGEKLAEFVEARIKRIEAAGVTSSRTQGTRGAR
jgi:hypothetical protein